VSFVGGNSRALYIQYIVRMQSIYVPVNNRTSCVVQHCLSFVSALRLSPISVCRPVLQLLLVRLQFSQKKHVNRGP